jgi:hypothetical protein
VRGPRIAETIRAAAQNEAAGFHGGPRRAWSPCDRSPSAPLGLAWLRISLVGGSAVGLDVEGGRAARYHRLRCAPRRSRQRHDEQRRRRAPCQAATGSRAQREFPRRAPTTTVRWTAPRNRHPNANTTTSLSSAGPVNLISGQSNRVAAALNVFGPTDNPLHGTMRNATGRGGAPSPECHIIVAAGTAIRLLKERSKVAHQ